MQGSRDGTRWEKRARRAASQTTTAVGIDDRGGITDTPISHLNSYQDFTSRIVIISFV
jgi:hypothetical protein